MYTKQELARLIELFRKIEGNKPHENAAPTYRDIPALREMAEIISSHEEDTEEVLAEKIPVLRYLSKCYDEMFRFGISVQFYGHLLCTHAMLYGIRPYTRDEMKHLEEAFYNAVKARNQYYEDGCEDLVNFVAECISADYIKETLESIQNRRKWHIKNDPVELTEEYLAVIDEVEELIEKNKKIDLCHEYWHLKAYYLAERGIHWRSPVVLNPGVKFD